jgi:hypothetical protein
MWLHFTRGDYGIVNVPTKIGYWSSHKRRDLILEISKIHAPHKTTTFIIQKNRFTQTTFMYPYILDAI